MNDAQKQAKEYAEILLAFSQGKQVEYREACSSEWKKPNMGPVWQFASNEYRIAPKPMEYWVALEKDHDGEFFVEAYTTKEAAIRRANNFNGRAALMREVTE